MSKDSFNNILLNNDALLDNSNFPFNISLNTPAQIHSNKIIPISRKSKII